MARQPYWPRYQDDKVWELGIDSVRQRPALLNLIGECATMWPFVELDIALLLGMLLGSRSDAALAMFGVMRQMRLQRDAIRAAAGVTLEKKDQDLIEACLAVANTASSARDDLVHGMWGVSQKLPDALLWIEIKHVAPWNTEALLKETNPDRPTHDDLARHFFVYTGQDLEEVRNQIATARHVIFTLVAYIRWRPGHPYTRAGLYDQLLGEPLVHQAIDRLQAAKK